MPAEQPSEDSVPVQVVACVSQPEKEDEELVLEGAGTSLK